MKNPHVIIRLVIITAALIGLGIIAFKYLHRQNNDNVEIQTISRGKLGTSHTSTKNGSSSGITAQGGSSGTTTQKVGCSPHFEACSGSGQGDCCGTLFCCAGKCQNLLTSMKCNN